MTISNIKKYKNGYTLIELVVVIAGIAALGSFTMPTVLNSMRLNKIEEAKAIMNGYASDCLGQYRISTDPVTFIEESTPDQLDITKLSTLGYKLDKDKNKCAHLAIKPLNDDEKNIYAFDFRMSSEGRILKTATPSSNPSFLNSCRGWAGKNCGLSEAQKAEFARLAALAKAKSECISAYNSWLSAGSSGESVSWDNTNENCTRRVFAFEGIPVNSSEAVEQALNAKYGRACSDWRISKRNSISPNGNPETKSPECGGVNYWFHSGNEYTSQADWTAKDNLIKEQSCTKDRSDAISKKTGKYTYGPTPGPAPCGTTVWLCNGVEYNSLSDYATTTCGAPPKPKPNPPKSAHCENFVRSRYCKPEWKRNFPSYKATSKYCICY